MATFVKSLLAEDGFFSRSIWQFATNLSASLRGFGGRSQTTTVMQVV